MLLGAGRSPPVSPSTGAWLLAQASTADEHQNAGTNCGHEDVVEPSKQKPGGGSGGNRDPLAIIRTVSSPSNVDPHRAQCHPPTQRARQVRADRHREHDQEQPQVGPAKHPGQRRWVDREHQREQAQDGHDLQRVATKCARQRCHAAVSLRCVPGAPCPTRPTIKRAVDHGGRSNLIVTLSRYAMCPAAP